jgi:hypothetical protein
LLLLILFLCCCLLQIRKIKFKTLGNTNNTKQAGKAEPGNEDPAGGGGGGGAAAADQGITAMQLRRRKPLAEVTNYDVGVACPSESDVRLSKRPRKMDVDD